MTNTTILKNLIDGYNELAYTHKYIFGFEDRGVVYMATATSDILPFVCTLDKASRGCGYALRFKPNKAQKEILKGYDLQVVCSKAMFDEIVNGSKYNRGEIFEKLVTEKFGQVWEKDNVPFTMAGDIEVDGIAYQIKFEKATFINEKGLLRMRG